MKQKFQFHITIEGNVERVEEMADKEPWVGTGSHPQWSLEAPRLPCIYCARDAVMERSQDISRLAFQTRRLAEPILEASHLLKGTDLLETVPFSSKKTKKSIELRGVFSFLFFLFLVITIYLFS